MNTNLPFGQLELPDDWEDQTVYQFLSPPIAPLDVPLAAGQKVPATRLSVTLTRMASGDDAALREHLKQLKEAFPRLEDKGWESFAHPTQGEIRTLSTAMDVGPGQRVHQVHTFFPVSDGSCINMTVTCAAHEQQRHQSDIDKIRAAFTPA